jgi:probable F420-dependent oxidoreductase
MTFGLLYNTGFTGTDPAKLVAVAQHAEACGFESFWAPEHVALPVDAKLGGYPFPVEIPILDPIETLTFVAAHTQRLLLATGVLLLPHHHPVPLAKRLATLDVLSGGRLLVGVGVGALPGEAAGAGIDFSTRGRRADEAIAVLRLLWEGGADGVSHHGEFFDFEGLVSFPKPTGRLPIHIGGSSPAAARRAGRAGDGYFIGGRLTPDQRAEQLDLMRRTAVEAGRAPDALQVTRFGAIDMNPQDAAEMARGEEGIRFVVSPSSTGLEEIRAQLSAFAERFGLR